MDFKRLLVHFYDFIWDETWSTYNILSELPIHLISFHLKLGKSISKAVSMNKIYINGSDLSTTLECYTYVLV